MQYFILFIELAIFEAHLVVVQPYLRLQVLGQVSQSCEVLSFFKFFDVFYFLPVSALDCDCEISEEVRVDGGTSDHDEYIDEVLPEGGGDDVPVS